MEGGSSSSMTTMPAITYPNRSSYLKSLHEVQPLSTIDGQSCFSCAEVFQPHRIAVVICPHGHISCSDCIHSWTLCGRKCPFCRHELFTEPIPSETSEQVNNEAPATQPTVAVQSDPDLSNWQQITQQELEEVRQRFDRGQSQLRQTQRRYLERQFHDAEEMNVRLQTLDSIRSQREETHPETFAGDLARLRIATNHMVAALGHLEHMQNLIEDPDYDSANDEEWEWLSGIGDHYCELLRSMLSSIFR